MSEQEWRNRYNFPAEKELIRLVDANPGMYGSMMSIISQMWRERDPIGAFTVGPCYRQVEVYGNYFDVVEERDRLRKELEEARKKAEAVRRAMQDVLYYLQRDSLVPAQDILEQFLAMSVGQEGEGNHEPS